MTNGTSSVTEDITPQLKSGEIKISEWKKLYDKENAVCEVDHDSRRDAESDDEHC